MSDVLSSFRGPPDARSATERLIDAAVQAGALHEGCRLYPDSRDALQVAAEWHRRRVARLATEVWVIAKERGSL